MKHIFIICFILFLSLVTSPVRAYEKEAGVAAQLAHVPLSFPKQEKDLRVVKLQAFLEKYNSPVASYAEIFVKEADEHNLDWKLVASIAGLESTFCRAIPKSSYNCWGWGIPTGTSNGVQFTDFENGIATVSEGLQKNYAKKGAISVEQIGRIYAASPTWAQRVHYFMDQLEAYTPDSKNQPIAMTL